MADRKTERRATGGFESVEVNKDVPIDVAGLARRDKVAHGKPGVDQRQRHRV